MDFQLSSEQRMIQDSIRRMVEREIDPILKAHDPDQPLPIEPSRQIAKLCAAQGLTSARVPESAGGAGLSALTLGLMVEQLPATAYFLSGDAVATRIYHGGTKEQCEKYLPGIMSGDVFVCSGLSEPTGGSDPSVVKTRAVQDGDDLLLTGHKIWISGASISELAIVTASLGQDARGRNNIIRVIVEREKSPYIAQVIKTLGLKQGHLGELIFDQCRVPMANLVGTAGDATKVLQQSWLIQRPLFGLMAVRMAQKAYDAAVQYAGEREVFGRKIGGFQLVQELLAQAATAITTSRLLCYYALNCIDNGLNAAHETAMAKHYAIDACTKAVNFAMEVHGAMGITTELGLEQLYRDIRMLPIPDATNQILTLIEGREITGISALRG